MRIKTVYQFAPYIGVQWNFSPPALNNKSYTLNGKSPKAWLPYVVYSGDFQCSKQFWTQFNAGLGFLYFSGLQGNLAYSKDNTTKIIFNNAPLKGRLSYNRTPLFDYLIGFQFNHWLKLALSYQHQGQISIQSKALSAFTIGLPASEFIQFTSNLSLDALLAKVYFEFPFASIWRSLSINPYLALGVGPGWQSWTKVRVVGMDGNTSFSSASVNLRQKTSANAVWMFDIGFRLQSAYPNSRFSVLMGCKYNQWGQARNIGKGSQLGDLNNPPPFFAINNEFEVQLLVPVRIKTVYQWAPYLGVQWSF
ncbi:MAG: hypothetical protein S4CHLAM7_05280 [Chlamydiae bacterium]|nr:hypothetical protein [Chlamydiota bacterium]